ncbi:hypothetical protein ASPZODRAFT_14590 [Penicilliopsis zonata CBS 506.65]|uniref:Uncharacterized protein n=1 Tax=Penicilliopsis zonata CBS 506.65 TaxID=1073090 RepID=A0A1L9SMW5_9EURO|nr:hypothetical protein ASPZODRAFT_14590 [Penicilliopsis zonata CBS 506.65]OJJ48453.1 hypothetical protein ASPZODRAFT_14590 [Penicilliopsis zonata CBS 506.65]
MFPPQAGNLDIEALSGICGSISIACWVVVFSPQIIENFRRGSADGLSLLFLVVWLAGDVFNILGAVLQGVLPTMIILAVYYTLADIVLLGQCFYYRGFTLRDEVPTPVNGAESRGDVGVEAGVQAPHETTGAAPVSEITALLSTQRRHSATSFRDSILNPSVDGTHLSPATPFIDSPATKAARPSRAVSTLQAALFNITAILLVCAAGVLGWYVSPSNAKHHGKRTEQANTSTTKHPSSSSSPSLDMDPLGQVFGYLCAVLYLGSRLPQLLLNFRRKSTEGVSLLFFLFACIGNLTYVLSILAYSPPCIQGKKHCQPGEASTLYARYVLVNLSWLVGSLGTFFLDMAIFVQFFLYRDNDLSEVSSEDTRG